MSGNQIHDIYNQSTCLFTMLFTIYFMYIAYLVIILWPAIISGI